jgi:hypothetical protein
MPTGSIIKNPLYEQQNITSDTCTDDSLLLLFGTAHTAPRMLSGGVSLRLRVYAAGPVGAAALTWRQR